MANRLEQLQQFYQEDPEDPFNIYGLALEYLKTDLTKARELFDCLLRDHASYVPTYYHAAKFYADINERERAIEIYKLGIEQAKRLKEHKALRELQSAYDELVYE